MKTPILLLIGLLVSTGAGLAATMTIDVPDADVPRILEAYGSINNLGRNATSQEVQFAIQKWLKESTQDFERRKNMAGFTPPPMSFSPTPTPGTRVAEPAKAAAPTATPKKKK